MPKIDECVLGPAGEGTGVAASKHKRFLEGDENSLKLDGGDGCTTLYTD